MNPNDRDNVLFRTAYAEGVQYSQYCPGLSDDLAGWDRWAGCPLPPGADDSGFPLGGPSQGSGLIGAFLDSIEWWAAYPTRYAARRDYAAAAAQGSAAARSAEREAEGGAL